MALAAVALMMTFLDLAPDAPDPPDAIVDANANARSLGALHRQLEEQSALTPLQLAHPIRASAWRRVTIFDSRQFLSPRQCRSTHIIECAALAGRRICIVRLDLELTRAVAHAHGAKINDVVLAVVSGGVRELLMARREAVDGVEMTTSVPATLRIR